MSNKDHNIIFLSAKSLSLSTHKETGSLKIPENIDSQQYQKLLENHFENQQVKQKDFSIVLTNELVFKKTIPLSKPEEVQALYEKFLIQIPISSEHVVILRKYKENDLIVFAANRELYLPVKKALEHLGGQVKEVLPLSTKNVNFLSEETKISHLTPIIRKSNKKRKKIFIICSLLVSAIALIIFFFWLLMTGLSKKALEENKINSTNQVVTYQASSSAQPETLTSDKISINVLNGSGIEKQGLKIKSELEKANFKNIKLDTLPIQKGTSVIQFGPRMTASMAKDVLAAAKKVVSLSEEASSSAKADVIIIIKK